jgi:hypothetical protein
MVCESKFGPYDSHEIAFSAAENAGFPLLFSDNFVRVKVEEDGSVNEEWATVWRIDNVESSILVCALSVEGEDRHYPGTEPFGNVIEYEKRWKWPTWMSQSWVCSQPFRHFSELTDDYLCKIFLQDSHYELTLETEMLGLGRSGKIQLSVRCPASEKALAAAVILIRNSGLPELEE